MTHNLESHIIDGLKNDTIVHLTNIPYADMTTALNTKDAGQIARARQVHSFKEGLLKQARAVYAPTIRIGSEIDHAARVASYSDVFTGPALAGDDPEERVDEITFDRSKDRPMQGVYVTRMAFEAAQAATPEAAVLQSPEPTVVENIYQAA